MIEPPRPPASRCGTPALTVFHTPLRLTSIISCHRATSVLCNLPVMVPMPALATMTSSRPQLFDAAVDRCLQRVEVTHVDLGGHHTRPGVLDHARGDVEVFRCGSGGRRALEATADVDRNDVGTLLREPDSVTSALPPCRTGHEGDLAVHPTHGILHPSTLGDRPKMWRRPCLAASRRVRQDRRAASMRPLPR